mgnify:FL=1
MKRILADTNFYGLLSKDEARLKIVEKIKISSKRTPKFINYGNFKKLLRGDSNELF